MPVLIAKYSKLLLNQKNWKKRKREAKEAGVLVSKTCAYGLINSNNWQ